MTEADLVKKIQELKKIKPRKDWVILTKSQILGEEPTGREHFSAILRVFPRLLFQYKPAFATLIIVGFLVGAFGFAQNSLPGNFLYPLKKITEKSQAVFVSKEKLPGYNLGIANKRLEELTKIAETNQVKKMAPAIEEFQAGVSEAAKNLVKVRKVDKEIVAQTKKLKENKESVEKVLATKIETKEYDNAIAQLVENQIKDLETRTLTEDQEKLLAEAKKDFEAGSFTDALVKILILSQS